MPSVTQTKMDKLRDEFCRRIAERRRIIGRTDDRDAFNEATVLLGVGVEPPMVMQVETILTHCTANRERAASP